MCSVEGCDRRIVARGFCQRHYDSWRYHGDPLKRVKAENGEPTEWLLAHVSYAEQSCLFWPFGRMDGGRGTVCFEGEMGSASRAMCRLANGEPPTPEHQAAHSCGNGHLACVNPKHLRWATCEQNSADMTGHGTVLNGSKNPSSKLTEGKVLEIERRLRGGETLQSIADDFDVNKGTIWDIKKRKSWGWLTEATR